jgi:hypothetical protein
LNQYHVELLYGIAEGFALIAGIALIFFGIAGFKRHAEMRGMMGQQHSMAKPLLTLICGSILLALPSMLPAIVTVIFSQAQDGNYNGGIPGMTGLVLFLRFLGLCAVIKGSIMLSKTGGYSAQPGMRGKAFIHIFSGILLLHIVDVSNLAQSFF